MSEELRNRVRQVIADEFGQKVEDVTDDKEFVDDLFADSLDSINLACVLEDTFDIEVSQLDARKDGYSRRCVRLRRMEDGAGSVKENCDHRGYHMAGSVRVVLDSAFCGLPRRVWRDRLGDQNAPQTRRATAATRRSRAGSIYLFPFRARSIACSASGAITL
ncbi:MAG: acyl carrier protein [Pyrinomonadaceae bacterium]